MRILTFVSICSLLLAATESSVAHGISFGSNSSSSSSSTSSSFSQSSSSYSSSSFSSSSFSSSSSSGGSGQQHSDSHFSKSKKTKDVIDGKVHEKSLDMTSIPGTKNAVKAVFDENDNGKKTHKEQDFYFE